MLKQKYENWTKEFMESWKELDWERTLKTLDKEVKTKKDIKEFIKNYDYKKLQICP